MLILPSSCFLHVPKTGGTWVADAIRVAGIPCEVYRPNGEGHPGLDECPCPEKFKFAFVRHPVSLYRSYWQFKLTVGWDQRNQMDQDCQASEFTQFVDNVLTQYPGVYSQRLSSFVGKPGSEIEFIGKYENLVEDLVTALKLAGEVFDEDKIRSLPSQNVSDKSRFPAVYTPELEQRVRLAEREAIERFGYD